jgi:tRNA1(Val) A37 N6-methylase TrmN6
MIVLARAAAFLLLICVLMQKFLKFFVKSAHTHNLMSSVFASMPGLTNFTDGVMINAHCLDVLKKMKDKSVSAIIIDPPYGAQTHNQNVWDIAWSSELWQEIVKECFRVLVKGGHMVVFASGKTIFDIHMNITSGYQTTFKESPSFYRMIWKHNSLDSGRVHAHTPRSQFEDLLVYYRTGEGKQMFDQGTLHKGYALDHHVGRANVLEFYKDDCRNKTQPTVKNFFQSNSDNWTFDYKPEGLMRALIRDFTSPGNIVVDFCMRHGMTAVAAKLESRKFIVVELEKEAYKRAVSRYSELFSVAVPAVPAVAVALPVPTSAVVSPNPTSAVAVVSPVPTSIPTSTVAVASPVSDPNPRKRRAQICSQCGLPRAGHKCMMIPNTTDDVDSNSEELVSTEIPINDYDSEELVSTEIPFGAVMKKRTRGRVEPEEVPPKRQAVSHEGKILDIGTQKRCTRLFVFKNIVSIDGNEYLVAYPDKIDQLQIMKIEEKNVQGYVGEISATDMESLRQASMPSRF